MGLSLWTLITLSTLVWLLTWSANFSSIRNTLKSMTSQQPWPMHSFISWLWPLGAAQSLASSHLNLLKCTGQIYVCIVERCRHCAHETLNKMNHRPNKSAPRSARVETPPGFHVGVTGELLNLSSCIRSLSWSVTLCLPGRSLISACRERAGCGTVHLPRLQHRGKRDSRDPSQDQRSVVVDACRSARWRRLSEPCVSLPGWWHAAAFAPQPRFIPLTSYVAAINEKLSLNASSSRWSQHETRGCASFRGCFLEIFLSCGKCAKQCFQSDIDHFLSWHNEAACEEFTAFAPQIQDKHM